MITTKQDHRGRHRSPSASRLLGKLVPSAMPLLPRPMLCTLIAEPFDDPGWIFEPKLDGLRVLIRFDGRKLTVLSRNQTPQNFQFPDMVAAMQKSLKQPAIVDGEIVCLDENNQSSFRALQQRFHLTSAREVNARMSRFPAYVYLFDVLYLDRFDVTHLPLWQRKILLQKAVRWSDEVRWTESIPEHGMRLWREACKRGSEGIVGKQRDRPYLPYRSSAWLKIKCLGRQEFVIGGFTEPRNSRAGLGAILIGHYQGSTLKYAGKVGTGYTQEMLRDLRKQLDRLEQPRSSFDEGKMPGGNVHWVKPRLVAEIAFAEWTQHGLLRQPRFEGLRPDKNPKECRREQPTTTTRPRPANHG